jgi:hypothetical protein
MFTMGRESNYSSTHDEVPLVDGYNQMRHSAY